MASKEKVRAEEEAIINVEEVLEEVEKLMERTKVLYEQYFLGIQKLSPSQLHKDIERKMRELTQVQIRNTGLRYRLATLSQKFGSYNTYWKRTMREIEQGRYIRDVARVGRKAVASGAEIPPEVLHAMPKRMRDRILRDRELVAKRNDRNAADLKDAGAQAANKPKKGRVVHEISEDEESLLGDDMDFDAMFASLTSSTEESAPPKMPEPAAPAAPMRAQATPPPTPVKAAAPAVKPPVPRAPAPAAAKPAAAAKAPAPPAVSLPPGMTEREGRELYKRYVTAQEAVGDKTPTSYEGLMKSLSGKAPKILEQHGATKVAFNVVVKDNKVVLKAKPIK